MRQAICTSVLPTSETPVNQKNLSSEPLPSENNKNSKTNKERVTEFFNQAVQLPTSDCSIFTETRGLGPDQSHYNPSRLWSRLQTTLVQITRIAPK